MYSEVHTDSTGSVKITPTGTGLKIADGGISFDGSTPVASRIAGATLTGATITDPVQTNSPVSAAASTLTVTAAAHAGRTIVLNRAAGITVTLPAATGTGNIYRFYVQTTASGAPYVIAVASATDFFIGTATLYADGGDTVVGFATANTGTDATESDTITLDGSTKGGVKGAFIEITDLASTTFGVRIVSDASSTEASPFSVAV